MSDQPLRVLLADDDPILLKAMGELLAPHEETRLVGSVTDGAQAVDFISSHLVDVALLDVDMPVLDGIAAARQIREVAPSVTVVMLTALEQPGFLEKALDAGAKGYLTKTMPTVDLIALMHRARAGETVMGPRPVEILVDSFRKKAVNRREEAAFREAVSSLPRGLREVFDLVISANGNREIARKLRVSDTTVRSYVSMVVSRTSCSSRADLIIHAAHAGFLESP